jgi:hypothetical protein
VKHAEKTLDELKKLPLWRIVKSRVPSLSRDGLEYICSCPLGTHDDSSPSFKVYQKDQIWLAHCFGCGATLNCFQFVEKMDKISFDAAVEKVKAEFQWEEGKEIVESTFAEPLDTEKKFVTYPIEKLKPLEAALATSEEAQKWLKKRGLSLETTSALHWGFIQNLSAINPTHPWVNAGWIAIPTCDTKVTCIKYRSLLGKKTESGKSGILRAPNMLTSMYNLNSVTPLDDVFVCEGEPDVAALTQAGYVACALPSAEYTPTAAELDILVRANRIFLAGDMDQPGQTAMKKLWAQIRERAYLLEWPAGCKDANETLLKHENFQELVETLKAKALERPIPDFYDVKESLRNADHTNPMDNPRRLHMRDKRVDEMAVTLPGNVVSIFATYTGSGKTTWCLDNFELEECMKHGSVVLNYSAELSPSEFSRLVASNLLEKDRLNLSPDDFREAAHRLDESGARFYVGYNPDFNRIGMVLDSIEWAVRRLGAHIVVLDHLHFLTRGERDDIKAQADAMQRIKNIAVKYGIIFVVVGQSRKEQPNRKGRPSEASDAKGSETFVSDASTTYHLHRSIRKDIDFDKPETWPADLLENTTDIRLYKCRTKGPGKAVARQIFFGQFGRFYPFSGQEQK